VDNQLPVINALFLTGCYPKIMELLLANGAHINARTTEGKTPLKLALEYRRKDAAQMLKERGGTK